MPGCAGWSLSFVVRSNALSCATGVARMTVAPSGGISTRISAMQSDASCDETPHTRSPHAERAMRRRIWAAAAVA
eukprot:6656018-Prymnesium_polylepis.2